MNEALLSLGIDTCGRFLNLSLSSSLKRERDFCFEKEVKNHAAHLPLAIEEVLKKASAKLKEIQTVGVVAGPGSFTGLRVGMSTALGLKFSLKIPVHKFSSLYCLANYFKIEGKIGAFLDARKGEFYFQCFEKKGAHSNPLCESMALKYCMLKEYAKKMDWAIVLKGGAEIDFYAPNMRVFDNLNLAKVASREALQRLSKGIDGDEKLIPIYVRDPDAIVQM